MSQAHVVALHPFDDDQALGWLSERLDERAEWSISELARQFGWPRARLRRRLASWADSGRITQRTGSRGKIVIAPAHGHDDAAARDAEMVSRQAALRVVVRALATDTRTPPPHRRPVAASITALVLLLIAAGLTAVGLVMNARFSASFGQTIEAAVLLALIGLSIDALAAVLPTVAAQLWHRRSVAASVVAWTIWVAALAMTLMAAVGFASTHIGDSLAGRATIAGERSALAERIGRLRQERSSIAEARPVAAIEVELQRAQPGAQAVWAATSGCRDVTRVTSARACAAVLEHREALAQAQRRDAIDAELRAAETRLASLPAVAAADPQATMAAEIVAWLTAGHISPTPNEMSWLRTLGLALAPSLAGLIALLAFSLGRPHRR